MAVVLMPLEHLAAAGQVGTDVQMPHVSKVEEQGGVGECSKLKVVIYERNY